MFKSLFIFIFGAVSILTSEAQNYDISFSASGASTSIDSVKVENLTQCTSIQIGGNDILNLTGLIGVDEIVANNNHALRTYPNPFSKECLIEVNAPSSGTANIEISDINGKVIAALQSDLEKGVHTFKLTGISSGLYLVQIQSEKYIFTGKIISNYDESGTPELSYLNAADDAFRNNIENSENNYARNTTSTIQMQYNTDDIIKLTGISGIYRTVFMIVPTASQTVNFTFIPCTDTDGNHYSVVKIGEQWWMAENLNAGTFASITSPQVSGTKFCMDINGQEDPTCPMGGLYEWDNLMQGASFCNGSGAYPNDACATPVQGLCPNGWHIPSHYEWNTLAANSGDSPSSFPYDMNLGVYGLVEGGNLKANCTTDWWNPNFGATNSTGFTAIPAGDTWDGVYEDFGQSTYFWTSTATDYIVYYMPWVYALNYTVSTIGRSSYVKENGFSCRCVKD
jgi:uncharacterized protein (TIGR02145 family)